METPTVRRIHARRRRIRSPSSEDEANPIRAGFPRQTVDGLAPTDTAVDALVGMMMHPPAEFPSGPPTLSEADLAFSEKRHRESVRNHIAAQASAQAAAAAALEQQFPAIDAHPLRNFLDLMCPGCRVMMTVVVITAFEVILFVVLSWMSSTPSPDPELIHQLGNCGAVNAIQPWRPFTAILLHASPWHVMLNGVVQLQLGVAIENRFGAIQFTILYFLCGITGNLLGGLLHPCRLTVAASVSGVGLLGFQLCEVCLVWHLLRGKLPAIVAVFASCIQIAFLCLFVGKVDNIAHVGGILVGMALGVLNNWELPQKPWWYGKARAASIGGLILLVVPLLILTAVVGSKAHCEYLHY